MNLLLFAVMGGYIGWKLGRTICASDGRFSLTRNILIGTAGALVSEWLVVRVMGESAQQDFTVSASLASLGAIAPLVGVDLLRQFRHALKGRS
ncbi:hypothetical protein [Metallibacterium sp.]|uniref:hypothetical protein n=1 Tax=Metallibacterium sp. TaxID=2940281 RepID=UPI00262AE985|nr:hypothetical protein [Metallibacterium sp.]